MLGVTAARYLGGRLKQPGRQLHEWVRQSGKVQGFDETLCGADFSCRSCPEESAQLVMQRCRELELEGARRFDETLIYSERRQCAVVYAGTHQHLAVELALSAGDDGAFHLRTGALRLYEWKVGIRVPLLLSGRADVREWYNDRMHRFEVEVSIGNPLWGRIFGYRGWFHLEMQPCRVEDIPRDAKPRREERRE